MEKTNEPRVWTAQEMGKARWAGVSQKERKRLMQAAGKKGGRPPEKKRCFCGAHTWTRALSRNFDCCRAAGVLNLKTGPNQSKEKGHENNR